MSSAPPNTASAEAVATSYFDAIARRDVDAAVAHWAPDGIDDVVPMRVYRGHDEIRGFLAGLASAFPDLDMRIERVTAGDGVAVVEWRMTGTFTGAQYEGVDPTGRQIEHRGADCIEVEDGRIIKNTAYYDASTVARQVGLLPPQESGAERAMLGAFNAATKVRATLRERLER